MQEAVLLCLTMGMVAVEAVAVEAVAVEGEAVEGEAVEAEAEAVEAEAVEAEAVEAEAVEAAVEEDNYLGYLVDLNSFISKLFVLSSILLQTFGKPLQTG